MQSIHPSSSCIRRGDLLVWIDSFLRPDDSSIRPGARLRPSGSFARPDGLLIRPQDPVIRQTYQAMMLASSIFESVAPASASTSTPSVLITYEYPAPAADSLPPIMQDNQRIDNRHNIPPGPQGHRRLI